MEKSNPNYYGIIPASVRYNNELAPRAILLYSEVTALSNKEGFCFASNDYFAELYDVSKRSVSRLLSQLEKFDHIKIELINSPKGTTRKIYPLDKNVMGVRQKRHGGTPKMTNPQDKNVNRNNKTNNKTNNKVNKNIVQSDACTVSGQENDLLKIRINQLEAQNKELGQRLNKQAVNLNTEQTIFEGPTPIFDEFWDNYGLKRNKKAAQKAWGKLTSAEKQKAVASIDQYKKHLTSVNWNKKQMHPSTYLNGKRFNDDYNLNENETRQQQTRTNRNGARTTEKFRNGVDGFLRAYSEAISVEDIDHDELAAS